MRFVDAKADPSGTALAGPLRRWTLRPCTGTRWAAFGRRRSDPRFVGCACEVCLSNLHRSNVPTAGPPETCLSKLPRNVPVHTRNVPVQTAAGPCPRFASDACPVCPPGAPVCPRGLTTLARTTARDPSPTLEYGSPRYSRLAAPPASRPGYSRSRTITLRPLALDQSALALALAHGHRRRCSGRRLR